MCWAATRRSRTLRCSDELSYTALLPASPKQPSATRTQAAVIQTAACRCCATRAISFTLDRSGFCQTRVICASGNARAAMSSASSRAKPSLKRGGALPRFATCSKLSPGRLPAGAFSLLRPLLQHVRSDGPFLPRIRDFGTGLHQALLHIANAPSRSGINFVILQAPRGLTVRTSLSGDNRQADRY